MSNPDGQPGPIPEEGNVSMCIECGQLLMFRSDLTLRLPTESEALDLSSDENVIALVAQWLRRPHHA